MAIILDIESSPQCVLDAEEHQPKQRVSFGNVEVREYARCLGDHPTMHQDGPSLSIDWDYMTTNLIDLEKYEQTKPSKSAFRKVPHVSGRRRRQILQEHTDCTEEELSRNVEECCEVEFQRQICIEDQEYEWIQVLLESAGRKSRRLGRRMRKLRSQRKAN